MKRISVIVPVYNTEKYIKRCIDSIIEQNIKDIQIICIDDASTDNSLKILEDYNNSCIEIYKNSINRGAGFCKNLGMKKALGEYVLFVDSDDWIKKDSLNKLYDLAKKENSDIVYYGMELVRESDNICIMRDFDEGKDEVYVNYDSGVQFMKKLINMHRMNTGSRKFFKRDLLENKNIKFTEGTLNDDMEFTLNIYAASQKITCMRKNIYVYIQRQNGSISNSCKSMLFWQQYIAILDRVIDSLKEKYDRDTYKLVYADFAVKCLNGLYKISQENSYIEFKSKTEIINSKFNYYITNSEKFSQYYDLDLKKIRKLKDIKNIYIYGAGNYACDIYRILKMSGIDILGFIETNATKGKKYLNKNVYDIESVSNKSAYIVIAVSNLYVKEIREYLVLNNYMIIDLEKNQH